MGKTLIRVSCIDQRLVVVSPPVIASGGRNEDMVEFEFCPLWAGFSKTAVFYRDAADPYHAVVTDDKCIIPWEVLQTDGFVYFGVFGVKGDITRTSEVIRYRVTAGAITEGTKPSDPTPDIYEQLLGKMSGVESLVAPSDPYSLTGKLVQLDNYSGMPMHCVTHIEPVQAGSGDPYPAGGGKNLTGFAAPESIYGLTVSAEEHGFKIVGNCTESYNESLFQLSVLKAGTYTLSARMKGSVSDGGANLYISVDGTMHSIWRGGSLDGVYSRTFDLSADVESCNVRIACDSGATYDVAITDIQLEIGSTATAYVPYSNIRPISGHTGAKLTKCGKNLAEQIVYGYVTLDGNNAYVRIDNNSTSVIAGVVEGNEYTISCGATFDRFGIGKLEAANPTNGALLTRYRYYGNQSSAHELHFTAEFTGTAFIYLKSTKDETAKDSLQVEIGSVATEYTPYQGETFSANFGQTVYGGTLDWNTGVLTVDRLCVTSAQASNILSMRTYVTKTNTVQFRMYFGNKNIPYTTVVSNVFPDVKNNWNTDRISCSAVVDSGIDVAVPKTFLSKYGFDDGADYNSDVTAFRAWLADVEATGTTVQLCYELAAPTVIQLTPAQITALQGMNNICCDAGETTVSGRKDILWLTSGLLQRIQTLEATVATLEAAALSE